MENFTPRPKSAYSLKHRLKARLWNLVNTTLFRWSFFFMRRYRIAILRIFGAKIEWSCSIDRTTDIIEPWKLKMNKKSSIGAHTLVMCHSEIEIGEKTCIGRDVFLLTGSHNVTSNVFELTTAPIKIGNCVWIATRSTVGKGVTIGEGAVVAAESNVIKNVAPWTIVGGNPAKFIKTRVIKE